MPSILRAMAVRILPSLRQAPASTEAPRAVPTVPDTLAELFARSRRVTVLTGAGLSVPSGLPPYRDAEGFDVGPAPIRYREFLIDPAVRLRQWERSVADDVAFAAAKPNAGHLALAKLAAKRGLRVVTQNVDGLHRRAGTPSESLVELHGSGETATCLHCGRRTPLSAHAGTVARGEVPTCEEDGHFLKPAVVMFGDMPLRSRMATAEDWARDCDLFIVAGTSLAVTPGGFLPKDAHHSGAIVAVINPGALKRQIHADLTVWDDAVATLATLAA